MGGAVQGTLWRKCCLSKVTGLTQADRQDHLFCHCVRETQRVSSRDDPRSGNELARVHGGERFAGRGALSAADTARPKRPPHCTDCPKRSTFLSSRCVRNIATGRRFARSCSPGRSSITGGDAARRYRLFTAPKVQGKVYLLVDRIASGDTVLNDTSIGVCVLRSPSSHRGDESWPTPRN